MVVVAGDYVTEVKEEHPKKTSIPRVIMPGGSVTELRDE